MSLENWMSWEGGVDLVALTQEGLQMPNVIVHVARMVHTPAGSAPSGMLFWQPDVSAAPQVFGFVSSDAAVGAYFGKHIFAGTPFENAPVLVGDIRICISPEQASARVEVPGFLFESTLIGFSDTVLINRVPAQTAPFHQQGLEAAAAHASLKVNGADMNLIIPPVGMSGGPAAVLAACGIYAR
jgi:hypothetical protein